MTPKVAAFLDSSALATPCLVLDLDRVAENYAALRQALPAAKIYYAVKANPAAPILRLLVGLGSCFDAASIQEINECIAAGASARAISFGNTVKKPSAIAAAFAHGVPLYAFDSIEELHKIAAHAPGSQVYCRIAVNNVGADWPLSKKFGTTLGRARDMMLEAPSLGLVPHGLSFHVGSQQTGTAAYEMAIAEVAMLFTDLKAAGIELKMLNLGGGFPIRYQDDVPSTDSFGHAIMHAMTTHFGNDLPDMLIEPGRAMVGNAGVVAAEVVLVCRRMPEDERRWVYLDIGRYGGLAETEGEAIRYQITAGKGATGPVVLAGPSCDGVDIMYEKTEYRLPLGLQAGERVLIHNAGAYVTSYASQNFNGFAPLAEHYL
ncbi:MAG: ornithine decarboxylase [Acidocella sp. 20-57-95]|nr:MAG: ornithine decarboxylase [Acidocella sp. 20-57-95]OYV61898.1 MAG: ornithine decarboxylase [Acidocella sp. 21-58-7]HQT64377.1 type III PLP-dependent enzyme [Acidocella sp.]HQU03709.1 type III PLP-dependent enzyme [Acidocella sp.]